MIGNDSNRACTSTLHSNECHGSRACDGGTGASRQNRQPEARDAGPTTGDDALHDQREEQQQVEAAEAAAQAPEGKAGPHSALNFTLQAVGPASHS